MCFSGAACSGAQAGAAPPVPTFAKTVVLTAISGKVSIRVPGAPYGFVQLAGVPTLVPVGTMVDTTAGRVRLTSADPGPKPAVLQTGQFFRGIFRIDQSRSAGGLVNLVIRDNLTRLGVRGDSAGSYCGAQLTGARPAPGYREGPLSHHRPVCRGDRPGHRLGGAG